MKNKTCNNCYYYDKCDHTERCEYYDPIYGGDATALKEYNEALKERVDTYQEIIDEMNN